MHAAPERWEQGSDFHLPAHVPGAGASVPPWSAGVLVGSGRDALRLLVRHGRATRGWRRLWVPAYLCQEVVAAIAPEGIALAAYLDLPGGPVQLPETIPGDVLLVVNTFGLRGRLREAKRGACEIVEDHTHDPLSPWAESSEADFAVVSLRKTLPVPEGGVLWSPRRHSLPGVPAVTPTRARAADSRREGMRLKARYLAGEAVEKEDYRRLVLAGETGIAAGDVSGMTPETRVSLAGFPGKRWREVRRRNYECLAGRLGRVPWLRVLRPEDGDCVPFSVVLVLDNVARRDRVRAGLIGRCVYPAVLWPLEEPVVPVPEPARALSRRILSLHCDFRYDVEDLARVAALVEEAGAR